MANPAEIKRLNFVSWNTNGILKKFPKVLDSLSTLKADIAFIQETHIGPKISKIFKEAEKKNWTVFFTVYSSTSKGVAIMIKKGIQFEYICNDEDCNGSYIVLFCYLYGELYTLVNVYNHKADKNFLGRLKEYLMETADGVLVVGGDFNTVLRPTLDRKPPTLRRSPFSLFLEDFTVSLKLKDTWSHLHPTKEGFTRRQNESYSRIDMFFISEDKIKRVCSIRPDTQQDISDHYPLVLTLKVHVQTQKTKTTVARLLPEHKYKSEMRAGKISGAEILSAIKSLPDVEEDRPDDLQIYTYKRSQCQLTEILKIHFNNMLKDKYLYTEFNEFYLSGGRHIFNVDYLIFSQILAERLSAVNYTTLQGIKDNNLHPMFRLTFETGKQEIKWSFLKKALKKLQQTPSNPSPDFSILDCILPKVRSSGELRHLQCGCPLTNTILNLALKYLRYSVSECEDIRHKSNEQHDKNCKIICMASFCSQGRDLLIHAQLEKHKELKTKVNNLKKKSALKININCSVQK